MSNSDLRPLVIASMETLNFLGAEFIETLNAFAGDWGCRIVLVGKHDIEAHLSDEEISRIPDVSLDELNKDLSAEMQQEFVNKARLTETAVMRFLQENDIEYSSQYLGIYTYEGRSQLYGDEKTIIIPLPDLDLSASELLTNLARHPPYFSEVTSISGHVKTVILHEIGHWHYANTNFARDKGLTLGLDELNLGEIYADQFALNIFDDPPAEREFIEARALGSALNPLEEHNTAAYLSVAPVDLSQLALDSPNPAESVYNKVVGDIAQVAGAVDIEEAAGIADQIPGLFFERFKVLRQGGAFTGNPLEQKFSDILASALEKVDPAYLRYKPDQLDKLVAEYRASSVSAPPSQPPSLPSANNLIVAP